MKTTTLELQKFKDKSFILSLTIKQDTIATSYHKLLSIAQKDFTKEGFRKGKVPLDILKNELSESKIIEEILSQLVTDIYNQKIKEYKLHPIIQPQVKILNPPATLDKDWKIEITGSELPQITLDPKYADEIKKINQGKEDDNQKINLTMDCLIKNSTVDLPIIIIEADVQNKLAQLVDQTAEAGITVNDYLKSKNQNLEKYREKLTIQVKNEWITNLAINQIAKDQKINITEDEVKALISRNQQLAKNTNLVYYLLTQQKVFDYLKSLS